MDYDVPYGFHIVELHEDEDSDYCDLCGAAIRRYGEYSDAEIARFSKTELARYEAFQSEIFAAHNCDAEMVA